MKKIFLLGSLTLIGYYWILFFRFCHPFPKSEFFTVVGIQLGITFVSYLISERIGRIMVIICGLTLVRLAPISGMQSPIITLMGVFLGGVFGNFAREILIYYRNRKSNLQNTDTNYLPLLANPLLILIIFLLILTLDRFLIYFNAPYSKGFGILETMFVKGVSSKEAFALSMETITHLLFPLLYFYSENLRSVDKEEIRRDWKLGILIGIGIQFGIMLLQVFWNRNFLAGNTNLSLEANRVMGFFRDSGSATWIIPVLCFIFYKDLLSTKRFFYIPLVFLIVLQMLIAPYQGRGFWLLFLLGLLFLLIMIWDKNRKRLPGFSHYLALLALCLFVIILYQIPKPPDSTLSKLLTIPTKVISLALAGENPILAFDPHRYYFNLSALKVFLENPFFGSGIGSFIVNLKDPTLALFIPDNKIDNPSFFLGILSEVGFFGVILLILYTVITISIRENLFLFVLLIPALSFGYHVVQPDGGFAILLILLVGFKEKVDKDKKYRLRITMSILILLFLIHTVVQVIKQGRVPEFRQAKLGSYQLLAYEVNRGEANNRYHIFKGKTIWILAGADGIELDAFLDNSTSKKSLRQKWTVLNKNRKPISDLEITIEKNKSNLNLLRIQDNGYYLQVEELDEKGKPQFYGDVPFCIPVIHFTEKNEFL
jgi:hypothetical protein